MTLRSAMVFTGVALLCLIASHSLHDPVPFQTAQSYSIGR